MKYRLFLFRVLAMGLPLLLLVLAEGILRLVGVDSGSRHLFQAVPGEQAYQTINPDYMQRYFRGFAPSVAFDPFLREKDDNTFRVFVLGGSTTAGFPYQSYHGFPGRLGSLLQAHAPGQRVEVINMGVQPVALGLAEGGVERFFATCRKFFTIALTRSYPSRKITSDPEIQNSNH